MKIKDILKKKAIRALDIPLYATVGYIVANIAFGKELMIFEILPYYLAMMFIVWAGRCLSLHLASKKKAREEIENRNSDSPR